MNYERFSVVPTRYPDVCSAHTSLQLDSLPTVPTATPCTETPNRCDFSVRDHSHRIQDDEYIVISYTILFMSSMFSMTQFKKCVFQKNCHNETN